MLWHIHDSKTYILGSVHVMDPTPLDFSRQTRRAYSLSMRVVFETDLDAAPPAQSTFLLPAGTRLDHLVPPALFARLRDRWGQINAPQEDLPLLQPWWVALRLQFSLPSLRGITFANGVDRNIWDRAKADGREIGTLESMMDVLSIFMSAPLSEQISFLEHITEHADSDVDTMISAWRTRDQEPIEKIAIHRLSTFPETFGVLIAQRNHAWLPKITAMVSDRVATLVVVGALHCVGENGLPALLARSGNPASRVD